MILDFERSSILSALESAHIWYMPLKGSILKDYYPRVGMRQMSDNDILVDPSRADGIQEIMTGRGYITSKYNEGHRDDYQKLPVSHFEMHRVLFTEENGEKLFWYYQNVKNRLVIAPFRWRHLQQEIHLSQGIHLLKYSSFQSC